VCLLASRRSLSISSSPVVVSKGETKINMKNDHWSWVGVLLEKVCIALKNQKVERARKRV
jgi:hypothetical protein